MPGGGIRVSGGQARTIFQDAKLALKFIISKNIVFRVLK